jgi:hypothetical protein
MQSGSVWHDCGIGSFRLDGMVGRYVMGFFVPCVWLVPFGFFVSLSVNESVLPSTDSMKAPKPAGPTHTYTHAHHHPPRPPRSRARRRSGPSVPISVRAPCTGALHTDSRGNLFKGLFSFFSAKRNTVRPRMRSRWPSPACTFV